MEIENASTLTVTGWQEDEGWLLEVAGQLDRTTASQLSDPLMQAVLEPAFSSVTVDLSRVNYMDGVGLAALVQANEELRKRSRRLRMVLGLNDQPQRILKLSRFIELVDLTDVRLRGPQGAAEASGES